MLEIYGNIWDLAKDYDAIVITTNGFVKKNGEAVMGRGIALEAKQKYPWLPLSLGRDLRVYGNVVNHYYIKLTPDSHLTSLYTFPVKPEFGLNGVPGWKAKADISLIENSAMALKINVDHLVEKYGRFNVLMPRPGCGNGGLKWEDVKPVIEPLLDDRFTVCTYVPD